ncbi:MAG: hypothetical protein ACRDWV_07910 [Acidimicrobiales bacterium]
MTEDTGARQATGQGADKVEGVDLDTLGINALGELAAGRSVQDEFEGFAVDLGPRPRPVGARVRAPPLETNELHVCGERAVN